MNKLTALITMICFLSIAGQAQLLIKNSTGHVLMEVDGNANVIIGSASQTGDLTTDNIIVNDGLTYAAGAANGRVLRSNASGDASWGLENQRLSLSGNTLGISDGTGTQLNSVSLPTGSDNQNLDSDKSGENVTVEIDRGNSTTFSIQDDDHNPNNELQDLGSSESGESVTVTITDGTNTSFSIQDDDHIIGNEFQSLSLSDHTITLSDGGGSVTVPASWNWTFQNVEYEPIELDVSATGSDHGTITFSAGVSGYTTGFFTIAGGGDPEEKDYLYLMKNNSGNWESWQCGGVSLDYDDASILAPVFENPAGSGNYDVYWTYRDRDTQDNVDTIYLYIGLVGLCH